MFKKTVTETDIVQVREIFSPITFQLISVYKCSTTLHKKFEIVMSGRGSISSIYMFNNCVSKFAGAAQVV